jgi:hypothetical protein
MRSLVAIIFKRFYFVLLVVSFVPLHVTAAENAVRLYNPSHSLSVQEVTVALLNTDTQPALTLHHRNRANFEREQKSREARRMADWVVNSGDNKDMPFVIVDKLDARVFVFDADGQIRGASPALLGLAKGDNSVPGIGDRELSDIHPEERTTPAGRFEASLGYNFQGHDVLWVDYNDAVSLHRVITTNPTERRLHRLTTPTPLDNRISYGCINVPARFYDNVVSPAFTGTNGIVYVLPEAHSNSEFFSLYYDVR